MNSLPLNSSPRSREDHQTWVTRAAFRIPEAGTQLAVVRTSSGLPRLTRNISLSDPLAMRGLVLWHPDNMQRSYQCLSQVFKDVLQVQALSSEVRAEIKSSMEHIREDLERVFPKIRGDMKPEFARELTSGAHAIIVLSRVCRHISVYGVTSYARLLGNNYQYGGRVELRRSGEKYHDWVMEAAAWRLLHASGVATVCSQ
mmetsp:Transcript_22480/g.31268  ORF Transcript_22480/g.31268 Transcript_22480/m.31268 type:complete len:200 (-) Transcript_22480:74-673(-)